MERVGLKSLWRVEEFEHVGDDDLSGIARLLDSVDPDHSEPNAAISFASSALTCAQIEQQRHSHLDRAGPV
jgi:hypothetical protein